MNYLEKAKPFEEVINRAIKSQKYEIFDGLTEDMHQKLKTIFFYSNSRFVLGDKDEYGRAKPFFNITGSKVNVATRGTDLDTKDFEPQAMSYISPVQLLIVRHEMRKVMKEINYGAILNEQQAKRARYGYAVIKAFERENEIDISVCNPAYFLFNPKNFKNGVKIEKHIFTITELEQKKGIWDSEAIDELIAQAGKVQKDFYGSKENMQEDGVCVYEIWGEYPRSYIREGATGYSLQCHYIGGDKKDQKVSLYCSEEKKSPYYKIDWEKVDGRDWGRGIVEEGIEAQKWTNDAKLKEMQAYEIASKVIFKSNNPSIIGSGVLDARTGDIVDTTEGDINLLNTTSNAIPGFQTLVQQWDTQYKEAVSVFESNTGQNLPSGMAFRTALLLNQESNSIFQYRTEEAGLWWSQILNDIVLPFIIKRLKKGGIQSSEYSSDELAIIDESFSVFQANEALIKSIDEGEMMTAAQYEQKRSAALELIKKSKRFLEIPKGYFDKIDAKITFNPTGENKNKQTILETLSNVLELISKNPAVLQDKSLRSITEQIIALSGADIVLPSAVEQPQMATQASPQALN